jgi:hypothetical protein
MEVCSLYYVTLVEFYKRVFNVQGLTITLFIVMGLSRTGL